MVEFAKVIRWVLLAAVAVVIALELAGYMVNWVMGIILVPLLFAFLYFWQLASRKEGGGRE